MTFDNEEIIERHANGIFSSMVSQNRLTIHSHKQNATKLEEWS